MQQKRKDDKSKEREIGDMNGFPSLGVQNDPMLNSEYEFNKVLYENPVSIVQKYIIYIYIGRRVNTISPMRFTLKFPTVMN